MSLRFFTFSTHISVTLTTFVGMAAALCVPFAVQAHATPITYTPERATTLTEVPGAVSIDLTEHIEADASSIAVYGPNGERVDTGEASVPGDTPRTYQVPLTEAIQNAATSTAYGTYTVSWRVVSADDGHFTKGAFSYRVSDKKGSFEQSTDQVQIEHLTTLPEAAIIWIELTGYALLAGVLLALAFVWKPTRRRQKGKNTDELHALVVKRFRQILLTGLTIALAGTMAYLLLKIFNLQQFQQLNDLSTFWQAVKAFAVTNVGTYAFIRLGLLVLFGVAAYVGIRRITTATSVTWHEWFLLGILAAIIYAHAHVSHAAAAYFMPTFGVAAMFAHVAAKEALVGLIAASTILFATFAFRKRNALPLFLHISVLAAVLMAVGGVSGVYITWLDLKEFSNVFDSTWGTRFAILLLLSVAMVGFRLVHQLVFEPRTAGSKNDRLLGTTLPAEALIGVVVLFMSGYLSITTPPFTVLEHTFERTQNSQGMQVTLEPHPYDSSAFLLSFTESETGSSKTLDSLTVQLSNQKARIADLTAETDKRARGEYTFPRNILTPYGPWDVAVRAEQPDGYDATASFSFMYPDAIEESRIPPGSRAFDMFAFTMLITGAATVIASLGLWWFSRRLLQRESPERALPAEPQWPSRRLWFANFVAGALVILLVWGTYEVFVKSEFQKLCERNGQQWMQGAPKRYGETLSPNVATGCMSFIGSHHFVRFNEYEYFVQNAPSHQWLKKGRESGG